MANGAGLWRARQTGKLMPPCPPHHKRPWGPAQTLLWGSEQRAQKAGDGEMPEMGRKTKAGGTQGGCPGSAGAAGQHGDRSCRGCIPAPLRRHTVSWGLKTFLGEATPGRQQVHGCPPPSPSHTLSLAAGSDQAQSLEPTLPTAASSSASLPCLLHPRPHPPSSLVASLPDLKTSGDASSLVPTPRRLPLAQSCPPPPSLSPCLPLPAAHCHSFHPRCSAEHAVNPAPQIQMSPWPGPD